MKVTYNKLVRDRVPEIISEAGHNPVTRVLDQASFQAAALEKLLEEAREARQASAGQLAAELADVLEVLQAVAAAHDLPWDRILRTTAAKRAERGAFANRIFLEYVEESD